MADLYSYFIERSFQLLNNSGIYSVIVANKWMRAAYGEPLREYLAKQSIEQIVDFGDLPVFKSATTYPCILVCRKGKIDRKMLEVTSVKTLKFDNLSAYVSDNKQLISKDSLQLKGWNLVSETENNLLEKIIAAGIPLGKYVKNKIFYGIKTGLNEAFVIDEQTKNKLISEDPKSKEIIKPFLGGKDIKRYHQPESRKYLIFFEKGFTNKKGNFPENPWNWLVMNYPSLADHLKQFEEKAKKRSDMGDYWWELRACEYSTEFEKPKIMLPDIALSMQALFDDSNFYCVNTAYIIPVNDKKLLGILNSKVVQHFYSSISNSIRGGYLRFIRQYLQQIPIPEISQNTELENLVVLILDLNKQLKSAKLPNKIEHLKSRIDYTDQQINQLVYQLYNLSEEEIEIIEQN